MPLLAVAVVLGLAPGVATPDTEGTPPGVIVGQKSGITTWSPDVSGFDQSMSGLTAESSVNQFGWLAALPYLATIDFAVSPLAAM